MTLRLRRLPDPVEWIGPSEDVSPPLDGPLAACALRVARMSGGDAFRPPTAREGRPIVAVRTHGPVRPTRWVGTPPGVRAAVRLFPSAARVTFDRAGAMVRALCRDLSVAHGALHPDRHALLCLLDADGPAGLLGSALAAAAPELPLVGGTFAGGVALDGAAYAGGAVVVLIASEAPLAAFCTHPFEVTPRRTVVTACDDSGRLVHELDGWPAVERFADLAGVPASTLDAPREAVLAALPVQLGWAVHGHLVLRPVVGRRGSSLEVASPVQAGLVLRVARRAADPAEALLAEARAALATLPVPPAAAWAFGSMGLFEADGGRVRLGLERLGIVAWAADGVFDGPAHSCGLLGGLVFGDGGGR